MTMQLIGSLQTVVRLMQMALAANDEKAYQELEPRFRQLVAQNVEFGMVQ